MTSQEIVKAKWPDAEILYGNISGYWIVYANVQYVPFYFDVLGRGNTEQSAWENAAEKVNGIKK